MSHLPDSHGSHPVDTIAQAPVGVVTRCSCGVLTLTLQYISLRFEPSAFQELQALLSTAQRHLDLAAQHGPDTRPDPHDRLEPAHAELPHDPVAPKVALH
jgi:hypothetical protein